MDEDEFDDEVAPRIMPRRARPLDFLVLFFCLLQQIAEAFSQVLDHTTGVLAAHANYERDQQDFADEIRADLENIPTTKEA